jgi:hypothetical protein
MPPTRSAGAGGKEGAGGGRQLGWLAELARGVLPSAFRLLWGGGRAGPACLSYLARCARTPVMSPCFLF